MYALSSGCKRGKIFAMQQKMKGLISEYCARLRLKAERRDAITASYQGGYFSKLGA